MVKVLVVHKPHLRLSGIENSVNVTLMKEW
jgi:hypothetical protein